MGAYKLNIGDATHYLKWDGAKLTIKGLVGDITLENTGFIRTSGKDTYADPDSGFWLGYDVDRYKLNIGDTNYYLKWTGSLLQIKGDMLAGTISGTRFNVGSESNEDIYFVDSGIHMYDFFASQYYRVGFKKDALTFCNIYNQTILGVSSGIIFQAGSYFAGYRIQNDNRGFLTVGNFEIEINAASDKLIIAPNSDKDFILYGTGELALPLLTSAPTGAKGRFAYNSTDDRPVFKNVGAWRHWVGVAGW